MEKGDRYGLFSLSSSAVVIICFFLPWIESISGLRIADVSIEAFGMSRWSSDWLIFGTIGLLFALSPIVLHAINIIVTFTKGSEKLSLILVIVPLAIWISLFSYMSFKAGRLVIPTPNSDGVIQIGFYGTLIGQIAAIVITSACQKHKTGKTLLMQFKELMSEGPPRDTHCPQCKKEYNFFDKLTQPLMCSLCWAAHREAEKNVKNA